MMASLTFVHVSKTILKFDAFTSSTFSISCGLMHPCFCNSDMALWHACCFSNFTVWFPKCDLRRFSTRSRCLTTLLMLINTWSNLAQDIQFWEFIGGSNLAQVNIGLLQLSKIPGMKPLRQGTGSEQFIYRKKVKPNKFTQVLSSVFTSLKTNM